MGRKEATPAERNSSIAERERGVGCVAGIPPVAV